MAETNEGIVRRRINSVMGSMIAQFRQAGRDFAIIATNFTHLGDVLLNFNERLSSLERLYATHIETGKLPAHHEIDVYMLADRSNNPDSVLGPHEVLEDDV